MEDTCSSLTFFLSSLIPEFNNEGFTNTLESSQHECIIRVCIQNPVPAFGVPHAAFSIPRPASRVQRHASSVQRHAFSVTRPASRGQHHVQHHVQHLASSVPHFSKRSRDKWCTKTGTDVPKLQVAISNFCKNDSLFVVIIGQWKIRDQKITDWSYIFLFEHETQRTWDIQNIEHPVYIIEYEKRYHET